MPVVKNRRKEPERKPTYCLGDFLGDDPSDYSFPSPDTVPEGEYDATVDKIVQSKSRAGNNSYDVCYTLKDRNGEKYCIIQRIPIETEEDRKQEPIRALAKALFNAGVAPETNMEDIAGVGLIVDLSYNDQGYGRYAYPQEKRLKTTEHKKHGRIQIPRKPPLRKPKFDDDDDNDYDSDDGGGDDGDGFRFDDEYDV